MEKMKTITQFKGNKCDINAHGNMIVQEVVDEIIRRTVKITEGFAGDIVPVVNKLYESVEKKTEMDIVIYFRENGLNTVDVECGKVNNQFDEAAAVQTWRLTYNPQKKQCRFYRVALL